jgi:hypothetical protein
MILLVAAGCALAQYNPWPAGAAAGRPAAQPAASMPPELARQRAELDKRLAALRSADLDAGERSGKLRAAVAAYRARLIDLRRAFYASDDDAEAEYVTRELARIDKAYPRPAAPPRGLPGGLERGLVLHYDFAGPAGGRAVDRSCCTNHGVLHGATWTAGGRTDGACWLEGTGQYVETPVSDSLCPTQAVTLSACVRLTLHQESADRLISKSNRNRTDYWLGLEEDRTIDAGVRLAGPNGGRELRLLPARRRRVVPEQRWVHLAFVYDGRAATSYVDGRFDRRVAGSGPIAASRSPLQIGRRGNKRWLYSSLVAIDDVMIWNRALTEVEVMGLAKWLADTAAEAKTASPPDKR